MYSDVHKEFSPRCIHTFWMTFWENSQNSAYSHAYGYYLFYSERIQSKITKWKWFMEGCIDKTRQNPEFFPSRIIHDKLNCPRDELWSVVYQGSSLDIQFPGFFLEIGHLAFSWHSKIPKGKQVFYINHIVCTANLGIVHHSYQLGQWEISQNLTSHNTSWMSNLQAGLSKNSSLRSTVVNCFLQSAKVEMWSQDLSNVCLVCTLRSRAYGLVARKIFECFYVLDTCS